MYSLSPRNFRPLRSARRVNEYNSRRASVDRKRGGERDLAAMNDLLSLARGLSGAHKLHTSLETERSACIYYMAAEERNAVTVSPEIAARIAPDLVEEVSTRTNIHTHRQSMHLALGCIVAHS